MIEKIQAKDRHYNDFGWLQTYWLFSFSDYYDPQNTNHGSLRVFNDDIVQPHSGFNTHPHEEMEIVSVVLEGEMTHKDSMGHEMVIKQHDVQRMTAGTGLHHSEWNDSDENVAFFQIWILPDRKGLEPSYDQQSYSPAYWKNNLALLASNRVEEHAVKLNSEASIYRSDLDSSIELIFTPEPGRCQFFYIIDGHLSVNGFEAERRDQIRIQDEKKIAITARNNSDFIFIDVPQR